MADSRTIGIPVASATRTAIAFRKLIGGGGGGGASGGSGGTTTGSSTNGGSSRCGFPHLWQNKASCGSLAPHVQYSGTPSVWHVILVFAMSGPTLLVIADPSAPFLKSLSRVPADMRHDRRRRSQKLERARPRRTPSCSRPGAAALLNAAIPPGHGPVDSFAVDRRRRVF